MKTTSSAPTPSRGPVDHEVRDQVVAAATEHFSRYGYEKTTVSDLAKAIGFSKAYIYKFFESKQAIGEMICAQCIAEIESSVAASLADAASPPERSSPTRSPPSTCPRPLPTTPACASELSIPGR